VRIRAGHVLLTLLLATAACRAPEPRIVPFDGPTPAAILVAPPRVYQGGAVPQGMFAGLVEALRGRGYRVLPLAVGHDLLREHGLMDAVLAGGAGLGAVQRELDVDAVLVLSIDDLRLDEPPLRGADWTLRWQLFACADGRELWSWRDAGQYRAPAPRPVDPTRAPDAEPDVQPFGTAPGTAFRAFTDLAAVLHRGACDHLPMRP
jgi:hypothetical protein